MNPTDWLEEHSSQIPALALLQAMGYTYLSPATALTLRHGKRSAIVLTEVLTTQLQALNHIDHRGTRHPFSPQNIQKAIDVIARFPYEALSTTSRSLYNHLTTGISLEQTIDGDKKSHSLHYIDWQNPENNLYHLTDEFEIERRNSTATRRPDIVLFVNGIPLVVIECKRPDMKDAIGEAISQQLRNHRPEEIPHFFCLSQLLLALSQNTAQYGTTATDREFWAVWQEEPTAESEFDLHQLVNNPLTAAQQTQLLQHRDPEIQHQIQATWNAGERKITAQDRLLYNLLQPRRLLELIAGYIVFDAGTKKIARYQQYFAIQATLLKVKQGGKSRQGGVIWHTTGSGKSITMVLLAKALAMQSQIRNPKIILVNDRIDLDKQLKDTFKNCGAEVVRANSGRHLLDLINNPKAEIITTVIDKFETVAREKETNDSRDIFVLVDEAHRSQYGQTRAKMEQVFPNACYIGFTGTPLLKKDKVTAQKFGGFIHSYSMIKAVADGAVVPILYEGRESEFKNTQAVDRWFDRITKDLTDEQKADLKRKFKSAEPLYEADARMAEIAYDLNQHFIEHIQPRGLKGQFATSSKRAAIQYKRLLDGWGDIRCEVIISPPDTREGNDSTDEANISEVQRFWKDMMARYPSAEKYQEDIIDKFKYSDDEDAPDVLIVVDKLLTGFDAPRNSVLYLDKRLKEHNILQAIARVNRVFDGKDYGLVIDYRGVFGEMNDAMEIYAKLEEAGFDREDIVGTLANVQTEIAKLPTHHAALWDVFKEVVNKTDLEAMQQWLQPEDRRDAFYDALRTFAKTLQLALSNAKFHTDTPEPVKQRYKEDLKYFLNLRTAVKQRYGETVDYSRYESQIRSMVFKELGASAVKTIIAPVNIFAIDRFEAEINSLEGEAAQADAIAARVKKAIAEKMEEDPVFYLQLSQLIEAAIKEHRAKRLNDQQYLEKVREHLDTMRSGGLSGLPAVLSDRAQARAYYNVLTDKLSVTNITPDIFAELAIGIDAIIIKNQVRDWQSNQDIKNSIVNEIDDLVHDLKTAHNLVISWDDVEESIEKIINIAKQNAIY
jgi:type I restriction enzyme, R subunit